MKMNNFDEELEQALLEYVQNTEVATNEKIAFSKQHKKKMEKLFEDVRNSNFEKGNIDETKGNSYHFNVRIFARVAVFIILALLITIAVTPSMVAWRKDKLDLYGGESGEYSWILPNDTSSILKSNAENVNVEDLTFFGFLPDDCKVIEGFYSSNSYYVKLECNGKYISLKMSYETDRAIDVENIEFEKLIINQNDVFFLYKEGTNTFAWSYDNKNYDLHGNLNKDELIKIIENMNYEEIEKFL